MVELVQGCYCFSALLFSEDGRGGKVEKFIFGRVSTDDLSSNTAFGTGNVPIREEKRSQRNAIALTLFELTAPFRIYLALSRERGVGSSIWFVVPCCFFCC